MRSATRLPSNDIGRPAAPLDADHRRPTVREYCNFILQAAAGDPEYLAARLGRKPLTFCQFGEGLGDVLAKSGRSTAETSGRVDGIGHYSGVGFSFRLVPLEDALGPMCLDGDSGSAWYDPATGDAVGTHCLGPAFQETETRYAAASPVVKTFARLALRMPDET